MSAEPALTPALMSTPAPAMTSTPALVPAPALTDDAELLALRAASMLSPHHPASHLIALPLDTATLRDAFRSFPTGVVALCAAVDGSPVGMAASSFTSVSEEPALVSVSIQHSSTTWPALKKAARVGVSVLSQAQTDVGRQLSSRTRDRFEGLGLNVGLGDALLLDGAASWLECSVFNEFSAGDHTIIVLEVHALAVWPDVEPLVYHSTGFRSLQKVAL